MEQQYQKRDNIIDGMKGLAIVFMVMGHSGFLFTPFFYLFHMSLFFMISGYLWNDKNVKDISSMKQYLFRKIKSLYIPFVLWNQFILLCNNLFIRFHIYSDSLELSNTVEGIIYHQHMGIQNMIKPYCKMFLFRTDMELGGATWFLAALFIVSIMHLVIRYVCTHIKYGESLFAFLCFFVVGFCQLVCMEVSFPLNFMIKRAAFAYFPFLLGYFLKKLEKENLTYFLQVILMGLSILTLVTGYLIGVESSVGAVKAENVLVYGIMTIAGWFFCKIPVLWLPQKLKSFFAYIGKHSLCIVLCHFLAFKVVSVLYVWWSGKPSYLISSFPTIQNDTPCWLWIAYTVIGILASLLLGLCARICKQKSILILHRN